MNLYQQLRQRAERNDPIRVGLIGAGKFGSMYLAQARVTEGVQVVGVCDLQLARAREACLRAGWETQQLVECNASGQINDVRNAGKVAFTEDSTALIAADLDVLVESTGNPEDGVRHAQAAIDAGRHVVMVTVEADVLVGPLLHQRARRAGVVYSMAYGDQPALICELVDWARTCGFEVVAAGKGTKYLPEYRYSTPETVFDYYGFSGEETEKGELNPRMFNSFLDGTKSAIEMAAVANATGLVPQAEGLQFAPVSVDQLAEVLKPKKDGGLLDRTGTVEVISCVQPDGALLPRDLRWGVFVTIRAGSEYVRQCFGQYGLCTDRAGWYAALYRPSHLVGLELGVSVASAVLRGEPTGAPGAFVGDVVACAKRDLAAGDVLDGEGGYTVYGKLMRAGESVAGNALPAGFAAAARTVRPVKRDAVLCYEDVQLAVSEPVLGLRRALEQTPARGDAS